MSFKVLVMSPLHQTGASTVAALMAQSLTYDNKTTTLVYTSPDSLVPNYLGVKNVDDPTRSIMQVVKLIDSNAIRDTDILDYAVPFSKNAYLLSFGDSTLPTRDALQIVQHVYKRVPTDVCIVDSSDDIDTPITDKLLGNTDCVFIVISPTQKYFIHLKYWMEHTELGKRDDVYVVVNHYDPVVASVRDIAKMLGMPANKVCTLHENPWIRKSTLNGQLHTVVPCVKGVDPRVTNLTSDLRGFSQIISSTALLKARIGE